MGKRIDIRASLVNRQVQRDFFGGFYVPLDFITVQIKLNKVRLSGLTRADLSVH